MSLSRPTKQDPSQARALEYTEFGPARSAGSGEVRLFEMPEFASGKTKASARSIERNGFIPLYLGENHEDPRTAAEREAKDLLATANGEAASIRGKAQQAGYDAGYEQGQREGREASSAMMMAALDSLGRITQLLDQVREGILGVMEEEIIALVAAATDMVLAKTNAADPTLIREVVTRAVSHVIEAKRVTVRLSPADLEVVEEFKPQLMVRMANLEHLEVIADSTLARGDCLVDTDTAQIDATLATRRDQLLATLDEVLHNGFSVDFSQAAENGRPEPEPETPAAEAAPARATAEAEADGDDPFADDPSIDPTEDW